MWDAVREFLPRRGVDHVERGHLVTAARQPVHDVSRVRRRVVPVERHQAIPIERVRIDQRPVRRGDRVANVKDGLLLLALPPCVEDAAGDRPRGRQESDRE